MAAEYNSFSESKPDPKLKSFQQISHEKQIIEEEEIYYRKKEKLHNIISRLEFAKYNFEKFQYEKSVYERTLFVLNKNIMIAQSIDDVFNYEHYNNSYIAKELEFNEFLNMYQGIEPYTAFMEAEYIKLSQQIRDLDSEHQMFRKRVLDERKLVQDEKDKKMKEQKIKVKEIVKEWKDSQDIDRAKMYRMMIDEKKQDLDKKPIMIRAYSTSTYIDPIKVKEHWNEIKNEIYELLTKISDLDIQNSKEDSVCNDRNECYLNFQFFSDGKIDKKDRSHLTFHNSKSRKLTSSSHIRYDFLKLNNIYVFQNKFILENDSKNYRESIIDYAVITILNKHFHHLLTDSNVQDEEASIDSSVPTPLDLSTTAAERKYLKYKYKYLNLIHKNNKIS